MLSLFLRRGHIPLFYVTGRPIPRRWIRSVARAFSSQKVCEMRRSGCKVVKYNEGLSDAIFELMFETLWVAPYDRRRRDVVWREFDRCARKAVAVLSVSDLDALPDGRAAELGRTMELFLRSVERVDEACLFPGMPARLAAAQARTICEEVFARCPAARPKRAETVG